MMFLTASGKYKMLRTICFVYLLMLLASWLIDSFSAGYTNWPIIVITAIAIFIWWWRNVIADIIAGWILTMLSGYMLLAVSSDFIKHMTGERRVGHPGQYFGFGYGLFGLAFIAAIAVILCGLRQRNSFVRNGQP